MNQEDKNRATILAMCATLQLYCYKGIQDGYFIEPPESACSGCLYNDRILSVLHGCPDIKNHVISACVAFDPTRGVVGQVLNPEWFTKGKINDQNVLIENKNIDFFQSPYDASQKYSFVVNNSDGNFYELNRYKFQEIIEPNIAEDYFFFGNTKPSVDSYNKTIASDPRFAICNFTGRTEDDDFYYEFELEDVINDEKDYKGCSGAPIMNMDGQLVSLVNSGKVGTPYIQGINLKKVLDILDGLNV